MITDEEYKSLFEISKKVSALENSGSQQSDVYGSGACLKNDNVGSRLQCSVYLEQKHFVWVRNMFQNVCNLYK